MKFEHHLRVAMLSIALTLLCGCGTPIYKGYDAAKDEWWLNGTSPGGMYGGFIGTKPSPDAVRAEAAETCPGGYETISESGAEPFSEGRVFRLVIRCHSRQSAQ